MSIQLPNECWCSDFAVHPKNWNTKSADVQCTWYISYRFYDPRIIDESGRMKPKQVIIKGLNDLKTLTEKQQAIKILMEDELELIRDRGYNRITKQFNLPEEREITEFSLLPAALDWAYDQIKTGHETMLNIKSCKNRVKEVTVELKYDRMELKDIKTRHVRRILNACTEKYKLSNESFNHYRTYLIILFKELLRNDAVDYNPVLNIEKKSLLKKLKQLLTHDERKKINEHFLATNIYFYRFVHVFFHSGARPVELLRLKKEDIDLDHLCYKVIIKKGKLYEEQLRPIKEVSKSFWLAQYDECAAGHYLFGSRLKPGAKKGTRDYITKKWQREVKRDMKINKDLYSLKHLNLDETAAILDVDAASKMAGHTSTVITMKHYLVNEKEREMDRLRKVNNSFSE